MAVQWIRGKQGLVDELSQQRAQLQNRIKNADVAEQERGSTSYVRLSKIARARLEAEIGQLNTLISWLSYDGVQLLTEAEYDARMAGLEALRRPA
jgi:hypothetical protein